MLVAAAGGLLAPWLAGCGGGEPDSSPAASPLSARESRPTRRWAAGLSTIPPQPTEGSLVASLQQLIRRADIGAQHENPPWPELLAGVPAEAIIRRDKMPVAEALRRHGLKLYVMLDPADGMSRSEEAEALRRAGRSLSDPAIQRLFGDYAATLARMVQPDYLGLAAETNLVRACAPDSLYRALVTTADQASRRVRAAGYAGPLMATVQVETAWGLLAGDGRFVGIEQDRRDFGFTDLLGLSSYPQFAFAEPEAIPGDYYQRLLPSAHTPVFVGESGWTSRTTAVGVSTPTLQRRFIERHAALLDAVRAEAWVQSFYADLDLDQWRLDEGGNLRDFASMGLVESDFSPKPALAAWDEQFSRIRRID